MPSVNIDFIFKDGVAYVPIAFGIPAIDEYYICSDSDKDTPIRHKGVIWPAGKRVILKKIVAPMGYKIIQSPKSIPEVAVYCGDTSGWSAWRKSTASSPDPYVIYAAPCMKPCKDDSDFDSEQSWIMDDQETAKYKVKQIQENGIFLFNKGFFTWSDLYERFRYEDGSLIGCLK